LDDAASALRQSQQQLDLVINTAPIFIAHADRQCRYRFVNRAYAERFGLTPDQVVGKHFRDVLGEQSFNAVQSEIVRVLSGETVEFEVEVELPQLGRRTMNGRYAPELDSSGEVQGFVAVVTDVTERRRAESLLHVVMERLPVGVGVVDPQGHTLALNPVGLQLHGFQSLQEMLVAFEQYQSKFSLHYPDGRVMPTDEWPLARALRADYVRDFEVRLRRIDMDHERMVSYTAVPTAESDALSGSVLFVMHDVTQRRHAEQAALEGQRRLQLVADNVPALISYVDRTQRYRFLNARYAEWFAGEPQQLAGKHLRELLGEDIYRQRLPNIERALRGEIAQFEGPTRHHQLGIRDTEISYVPDMDERGVVQGFYVMASDITQRKRSEQAQRDSEERFRTLADNIAQLAWMADTNGSIFWYNQRWFEYTGESIEAMLGWGWTKVHHPDYVDHVTERFRAHLAAGQAWEDTFPLRGKDGQYRWFLSRALPIHDEDGRIRRWFGTNTDVTDLRDAQEALRDTDRRKDEFLATLAHELRNPLAPIRTGLELIKMLGDDPETLEEVRGTMERQTEQLVTLVNDLLEISRITRGKLKLRKTRVSLAQIVAASVETSKPLIDEAGHQLTIDLPAETIYVYADRHRLAQVLSNLLNNAAKFTHNKGTIQLRVMRQHDEVVLTVKDNGIGIPADMLGRVFEMFAQIEHPLEKSATGLGIGLTLVKSLVQLHGGSVAVVSAGVNAGSEFIVRLPVANGGSKIREKPPNVQAATPLHGCRVLVVDDNRAAANMVGIMLRASGCDVRLAHDGLEAVEVAGEFLPNIVLMDLGMPTMNGFEAARRMRQLPTGDRMVLVAVSGWGQTEDKLRSKEAGFDDHLVKPADPGALRALLAKVAAEGAE
jgi:PAS domain S-box-containing protein